MENKRIDYIHSIRGIAIFFIVATHCNLFIEGNSVLGRVWAEILKEWTSVFLLISGFLFQHLLPKYEAKRFYLSKIKNVIIPYVIISIPAIFLYMSGIKKEHNWIDINNLMQHSWIYIVSFFYFTGSHLGPLWFIPMLSLIFLSSGALIYLGKDKKKLIYAAPCCIILIFLTARPIGDSNPIISYIHFVPIYILGMFIYDNKDILVDKKSLPFLLVGFVLFFSIRLFTDANANFSIIAKIFAFIILCIIFDHYKYIQKMTLLSWLANTSFAIYFMHGYFVGFIRMKFKMISSLISGKGSIMALGFDILLTMAIILIISTVVIILKKHKLNTRIIFGS